MMSTYRIERDRGAKDSREQLAVLREKWPRAFPVSKNGNGLWPGGVGGTSGTRSGETIGGGI